MSTSNLKKFKLSKIEQAAAFKNLISAKQIINKNNEQLLVRPIEIYEFSHSNLNSKNIEKQFNKDLTIKLGSKEIYSYKPNQTIKMSNSDKIM